MTANAGEFPDTSPSHTVAGAEQAATPMGHTESEGPKKTPKTSNDIEVKATLDNILSIADGSYNIINKMNFWDSFFRKSTMISSLCLAFLNVWAIFAAFTIEPNENGEINLTHWLPAGSLLLTVIILFCNTIRWSSDFQRKSADFIRVAEEAREIFNKYSCDWRDANERQYESEEQELKALKKMREEIFEKRKEIFQRAELLKAESGKNVTAA